MSGRACLMLVVVTCAGCGQGALSGATNPDAPQPGRKLFELLDDMEGQEPNLATPVGLASWYVAATGDAAGPAVQREFAAPDVPRAGSTRAQHVLVGAPGALDLRVDIHGPQFQNGGAAFPDLSAYAGVAFWARAPSGTAPVVVAIDDGHASSGSYATTRASASPWFEHPVTLSTEWRRHILLFSDFRQPDHPDAWLSATAVWSIHVVGGLDGAGAELWIDDISLLCGATCGTPALAVPQAPGPGMDERSLTWVNGQGSTPDTTCAVVAPLSLAPLSDASADPVEKVLLRARIPLDPAPAVTRWAWVIEDLASGARHDIAPLDETGATVALPITAAGRYQVTAHTHYPDTAVCGVATELDAR